MTTMKHYLGGGPLLGEQSRIIWNSEGEICSSVKPDVPSHYTFAPLITPLVGVCPSYNAAPSSSPPERFVLLPHERYIQVLAYKTGKSIAHFLPFDSNSEEENANNASIESVCLATYPNKPRNVLDVLEELPDNDDKDVKMPDQSDLIDHVVLVGCSDGTLQEFSLLPLLARMRRLQQQLSVSPDCSSFQLTGPCYGPRRMFHIREEALTKLTAPFCVVHTEYGLLVYALAESQTKTLVTATGSGGGGSSEKLTTTKKKQPARKEKTVSLLRILLPPYFGDSIMATTNRIDLRSNSNGSSRVTIVDQIQCQLRITRRGKLETKAPFSLDATVRSRNQNKLFPYRDSSLLQQNVFVVMAGPNSVHVYMERLSDVGLQVTADDSRNRLLPPVTFAMPDHNALTAIAISINKTDLACGFTEGDIIIKTNLLGLVEDYHVAIKKFRKHSGLDDDEGSKKQKLAMAYDKPEHPRKHVIDARVHWHAHPVTTLCYDHASSPSDPILYSGGNESVLVTWQLSRGINRPADVLPRLALGGIVHVQCADRISGESATNDAILVFCDDNTLQMFESHNKALLWKVKGLAVSKPDKLQLMTALPFIFADPKTLETGSSQVIMTGLPDAPGFVQWFDPTEQRVIGELEVAPYNRVSRVDHKDLIPMPAPSVTHCALSKTGNDLVTIDKAPTENKYVGALENQHGDNHTNDAGFGLVTTIRFWSWNSSAALHGEGQETRKPYDLVASMANPHGPGNRVSAASMSQDGQFACTVSNDEEAFRMWQKLLTDSNSNADGRRLPVWVCRYKITIPAGYSNHPTGKDAVAFSSDSSVLAISFGHMITVWDQHEMTLLKSLIHLDDNNLIDSIVFAPNDTILCKSCSGISLQSPFGSQGPNDIGWSWTTAYLPQNVHVSCAGFLPNQNAVAIAMYDDSCDMSRIVVVDLVTGEPLKSKPRGTQGTNDEATNMVESAFGLICSISDSEKSRKISNWCDGSTTTTADKQDQLLGFYALSTSGSFLILRQGLLEKRLPSAFAFPGSAIPRLPASRTEDPTRTKKRSHVRYGTSREVNRTFKHKKLSMLHFGSLLGEDGTATALPTPELPALSGSFARAFVGRNLLRKND